MANEEHLSFLKQGIPVWNKWREKNPDVLPDLRQADLTGSDLSMGNFNDVNLNEAILDNATLYKAKLRNAKLNNSSLCNANLTKTDLNKAGLRHAVINNANLSRSNLADAVFSGTDIRLSDFNMAHLTGTIFNNVDLSTVHGLNTIKHFGPSVIDIATLHKSEGKIPEIFLRGCGIPDYLITFYSTPLRPQHAIEFYSCFISYSTKDEEFAKKLHSRMQAEHLRVWFAPEDIKGGQKSF